MLVQLLPYGTSPTMPCGATLQPPSQGRQGRSAAMQLREAGRQQRPGTAVAGAACGSSRAVTAAAGVVWQQRQAVSPAPHAACTAAALPLAASPAATSARACGRRRLRPLPSPPLLRGQVPPRALACGRRRLLLPLQGQVRPVGRACRLCAQHQHQMRMQQQRPWQQQLQALLLSARAATPLTTAFGRLPLLRPQGMPLTLPLPQTAQLQQLTSSSMGAHALA